jgi:hypothetical protein
MAAIGSIIPNYKAAPHGIGYSDKAVRPQDLGVWETFETMSNWETFPRDWTHVQSYF